MTMAGKRHLSSWVARGVGYFAFWVLLIGIKPVDLVVGVVATVAATWSSIILLPPGEFRLRLAGIPRYAARFLWQSVVAGVQVALLAFTPQLKLRPGLISYRSHFPKGAKRNAFASLTSLLPGTLAVHDEVHGLLYHTLDTGQPIVEQLTVEETAVSRVLPNEPVA